MTGLARGFYFFGVIKPPYVTYDIIIVEHLCRSYRTFPLLAGLYCTERPNISITNVLGKHNTIILRYRSDDQNPPCQASILVIECP